jgi:gliding motility-associated-like protein
MKLLPKCLLATLGMLSSFSYAQRGKDGNVTVNTANRIVNEYTTLTANAAAGNTSVTVAASGLNANSRFSGTLAAGDLIMIIQMQGATILGQPDAFSPAISNPNDATWGSVTNYNNCGRYEYAQVSSVPNATTINIDCGLTYSYTSAGKVQIVRVPRYNTLTISAPGVLSCQVWNGNTGGVLAVEVLGNTVFNTGAKINTTGTGFRGGAVFTTTGRTTTTLYSCISLDVGTNKGEGIAGFDTDYTPYGGKYCRAAAANAGGGGNVWNCGGGGGGNAGNTGAWTGQGNPNNSLGGWTTAWNLESAGFAASTSSGGGRGGYSFSSSNQNATILGPGTPGFTNAWNGAYRYNLGGLGGRPLDYSTGRIYLGGGGGAGEQDNNQGGAGGKGGGIVYFVTYGNITGTGNDSIISDGAVGGSTNISGSNSGKDAGGGAGAGGTIILNAAGTVSGIAIRANGGVGGHQLQNTSGFFPLTEGEGPGGGGGGGFIAVSNGTPVQQANGGANGITQSPHLTEFLPNGATMGGAGLTNQSITNFTISATNVTICSGNTATLNATLSGTVPAGTTVTWWDAQTGGSVVGTGASFTTPVLSATTTYYVGTCPGTYRVAVVVTVSPGLTVSVNSATVCGTVTTTLTASGGTSYTWSAGATSTGVNTATVSPSATATYTVTGTTGSCSGTAVATITVNAPPVATFSYTGTPYCQNAANPSPTYSGGGAAGVFTSTTGLSINSGTGAVNLALSTPGTYTVTNTIPASGGCAAVTAASPITITVQPVATFSYTGTPYCQTAANPSPVFSGGGVAGSFTSTAGLSINAGTGIVNLALSTPGIYTVTNTIATSGGCPTITATSSITITPLPVATFSYTGTPYCQDAANPSPVFSGGGVAGTFTSTAGLSINSGTGAVNLAASTAGAYTVTNTIPASGGCPAVTATSSITITPVQNAAFSYSSATFCISGSNPSPTITGTAGGIFSSAPAGLAINASTGVITLATSALNSYSVTYTTAGPCPASSTFNVTITNAPAATFSYTASPYCQSSADPFPTFSSGGTAGIFTSSAGLVFVNAGTGEIDLSASTPGTYTVTNTISASGGCAAAAATSTITITAPANASFSYASAVYCQNGTDPSAIFVSGAIGGTFSSTAGLNIDPVTGLVDLSVSTSGVYTVFNTVGGTCGNIDSTTITINTPADATISQPPSICLGATAFNLTAVTGGGSWTGTGITDAINGTFDPATAGAGSHVITYSVAGTCGATDTVTVTVTSLLDATIANVTPACVGSSAFNLSAATAGGTWTGTGITDGVNGIFDPSTGTGTYTVTYTISGSCGNSDTALVTITPNSDATITQPASVCANDPDISLTAATLGGIWTGPGIIDSIAGTFDPSVAGTGTQTIAYTISGGCAATDTVLITIIPAANASITPVTTVCLGAPAFNLTAANPGGSWNGTGITNLTNGTFDPAIAGVGSHIVTYTISGTCGDADSITVNVTSLLDATIASATPVCVGSPAFNMSAVTTGGTWSGTGITDATAGTFTPSVSGTGTFTITYTISGSCGNSDTALIIITAPVNASINSVTPVCVNGAVFNLTAASAGGTWSGAGITDAVNGTFDPSVSGAGTFPVTYEISGACGDTASQNITVNALPNPVTTPDITNGCAPLCVQFTETASAVCSSVAYSFGDGSSSAASDPSYCYTSSGTYLVSITCTDANGCVGMNATPVTITVSPVPVANMSISPSGMVLPNTPVTFTDISTSGGNQFWNFGDPASTDNASSLSSDSHIYTSPGTYCISLVSTNLAGCSDSVSECIVVAGEITFSVPNVFTPNGDGNNDVFFISSTGVKELNCTIYDRWGLKIIELNSISAGWDGRTTSGSIATDGVYYYILNIEGLNEKTTEQQGFIQLLSK